jgi:hypothetical protein
MPEIAQRRAKDFFDHYSVALSSGDLEAIARCYAYPSLVVTDAASRTIATPEDLIDAFSDSDEPEPTRGLSQAVATIQSIDAPVGNVAWVTVRWSYRDEFDEEHHADAYRYLVRELGSSIEICTVTPVPTDWTR